MSDEKLVLEVGKTYLNGRGEHVYIRASMQSPTDHNTTIFEAENTWNYDICGYLFFSEGKEDPRHLVSEVPTSSITSADLSDKHLGSDPRVTSVLKTMMDFPVLSGRVTRRQAEIIVERLDNIPSAPTLELGKSYLTGDDRVITIADTVGEEEHAYTRGYRFVDGEGVYLTGNGQYNLHSRVIRDVVKEVRNMIDERIQRNRDGVLDDLGYLAAMGRKISAIKLYRSIYGGGLVQAKTIINAATQTARKRYTIPVISNGRRMEELELCLKETRKLVSRCSVNGFRSDELVSDLFRNNGAITRLVPMTPAERQASQEDLNKIMELDQDTTEIK